MMPVPRDQHILQIATKQQGIDSKKHQRRPDAGNQQNQIEGQRQQIISECAHGRTHTHPRRLPIARPLAACGLERIMLCLDDIDDVVGKDPGDGNRDHSEQHQPADQQHGDGRDGAQPAIIGIAEGMEQPVYRKPQTDTQEDEGQQGEQHHPREDPHDALVRKTGEAERDGPEHSRKIVRVYYTCKPLALLCQPH